MESTSKNLNFLSPSTEKQSVMTRELNANLWDMDSKENIWKTALCWSSLDIEVIIPRYASAIQTHTLLVLGTHIASDQCINLLNQIGLRRMHQAVFLRFTPEVKAVLSLIEPYVIYGTPNIISVRDLIFKYGFIKHMGRKTSISSNTVIEEIFGQSSGIICVEDIVHEVFTVGANFDKVTKAMYPFLLPNPKDGWIGKKGLTFEKGGVAGYRGNDLNEMLKNIL